MRSYSHFGAAALAVLALASCGQSAAPTEDAAAEPDPYAQGAPAIQLLCDAINAPWIVTATEAGADGLFTLREYSKVENGQLARERTVRWGQPDPGAGSIFLPLVTADGTQTATARWLNEGMLEEPSAAYTRPLAEVRFEAGPALECRWLARTRLIGFTGQRSFVVAEDADGDLIYRSYDFAGGAAAQRVDLDGAQRSTVFNVEVRGGAEETSPDVTQFTFENDGFTYRVFTAADAPPVLSVLRGDAIVQADHIVAYQTPPAMAQ